MKISLFVRILAIGMISFAMFSCASPKQIIYFQDIDTVVLSKLDKAYEAVIKKDDRLSIVVSGPDKSVCAPYNLTLGEIAGRNGGGYSGGTSPESSTLSYLVDPEGNISFPILGKIHVEGMTRNDLVAYLTAEIGKDVKDPIVYVAFKNYKITILGEVRAPGTYIFDSEKTTILQALGRAGDLNITAQRENIILMREVDGAIKHYKIDLRDAHVLDSPYFYLQQNDVLYVAPSTTRVFSGTTATGIWSIILSSVTTLIAVVSFVFALNK